MGNALGNSQRSVADSWVVVGLDNGGTCNNATVLDARGRFIVDELVETPSHVTVGPDAALASLTESLDNILDLTSTPRSAVRAVGLDTPGPASALGIISSKGATNFSQPAWRGYDFRGTLEAKLGLPVIYNNDGNAAALYAHHTLFKDPAIAASRSSVSAIIGTGCGGGVIEAGKVVRGAAGMAGELGHVHISMDGLLADGQPIPVCNCGVRGDVESIASLTGIERNLLPYWLSRYPGHELAGLDPHTAARKVRGLGEQGDPLARRIFEQQAIAIGRLFTAACNFLDPSVYFVGGGVVEAKPEFRDWFMSIVRAHTALREEQIDVAEFALVPDRDMAGARGSAIAARAWLGEQ
jgi:glucokinase